MTRMWCLPPKLLCGDHLRGEHAELHQLVGTIKNHAHADAIIAGHADKHQIDTARITNRHAQLVHEFETRGYNHDSPLPYDDTLAVGQIDVAANAEDLYERCSDCRGRMRAYPELVPGGGAIV